MSYKERMQKIWHMYEEANGEEPLVIRDCFDWATKQDLWSPRPMDVAKIFGKEMSSALRQEMRTDAQGRKYRAKHCVRETHGGVQMSFWGDIDKSPRDFIEKSVQLRRKGIVNDGYQLKIDVDHFNEYRSKENPIQLVLDITEDVAELEALNVKDDDEDAA